MLILPVTGTLPGLTAVQDINASITQMVTDLAGSGAPTTTTTGLASMANVFWFNPVTGAWSVRNSADTAWILLGTISQAGSGSFTVAAGPNYLIGTLFASGVAPTSGALGFPSTANLFWHDTNTGNFNVRNQADSAWISLGIIANTPGLFIPSNSYFLATQFASGTAPATGPSGFSSLANVFWHDTTLGNWNVRNAADSAWISLGVINASGFVPSNTKQVATLYASSGVAPTSGITGFSGLTGLLWFDTSTGNLNLRNNADSGFIVLGTVNQTDATFTPNPVGISPIYTTIGSLQASTRTAATNAVLYVRGYTAPNDGGQGHFLYRASDTTTADNGGTIIVDAIGNRWYRDTQSGPYSAKWFGAKGDSTTPDSTTLNLAISGLVAAGGGQLYIPTGFYILDAPLQVKPTFQPISFVGDGRYATQLVPVSGVSAILVDSPEPTSFVSMGISYATAASGTIGLSLACTSGTTNAQSFIRDCLFQNCATGIKQFNAQQMTVDNCSFVNCGINSIYIQDTGNVAQGNNEISNSVFTSSGGTQAHIFHRSGGGLTILGNQIQGANYGYQLSVAAGAFIQNLTISANNFSAQVIAGCTFGRVDSSGFFENIQITDNLFAEFSSGCVAGVQVPIDTSGVWVLNFNCNSNTYNGPTSSGFVGVSMASVQAFQIVGGSMYAQGGTTTRPYVIDSSAVSGTVGLLTLFGTGIASGVNNSVTTSVSRNQRNGSANITLGAVAVGGIFNGSGAVSFGPSYLGVPSVMVGVKSGAGAISAAAVSASVTGCIIQAFGTASGVVVGVDWISFG